MTDSMELVAHDRCGDEELVRKWEKERWDWLFKGKTDDFIRRKLSNLLPMDRKAVLVPTGTSVLIVDPEHAGQMASDINDALRLLRAPIAVTLTARVRGSSDQEPHSIVRSDQTERIVLTEKDALFLSQLFGGRKLKYIADKLNLVWLPCRVKILFPSAWKEVIAVDRRDPLSMVRQAQESLAAIHSRYAIDVVERDTASETFLWAV